MNWKQHVLDYPLGDLEEGYNRHHLGSDARQAFFVGAVWLIPNVLFIFTDYLKYANQPAFTKLLCMRLLLILVFFAGFFILKKVRRYATYSWVVFFLVSFALTTVFFARSFRPTIQVYYLGLDYIILLSIYLLVPNNFLFRTLPCVFFTLATLISYFSITPVLPVSDIIVIIISHIFANGLGILTSAKFYSFRRQQYESQARAQELRKDLIQNALLDELTGVSNRRHFFHSAEAEFDRFQRYKHPFSLLMLDLDHFKNVNDQFGHPIGDKVLKELASIVAKNKRDTDLFGRLGGEEFALLLPETGLSGATDIAVRLRRACHGIKLSHLSGMRITVSIGVTQVRSDDANFDAVLARADETLYRAKNNGRDRVEVA